MAIRICLICLVIFCPLAIDLYLPAFPIMTSQLATSKEQVQFSISLFMICVGLGQLFFGPMSDQYGRKRIALIGIALYFIGAIGCSLALNIEQLLIARVVQGFGAAATFVSTFAIVRDQFSANKSAQVLSYLNGFVCFIPALAPVLGAWLTLEFSWRSNFIFLSLFSLLGAVIITTLLPANKAAKSSKVSLSLSNFTPMLRNQQFVFNGLLCLLSMSAILAFVTKAPHYLMNELKLSETEFTIWFSVNAAISIVASFSAPILIKRSSRKALTSGLALMVLSGIMLLLLKHINTVSAFMLPIFIASIGFSLALGAAAGSALSPFKQQAGAASALIGLLQMSGAGLFVTLGQLIPLDVTTVVALHLLIVIPFFIILLSNHKRQVHPATSSESDYV